jgi:8-oxo-dGTP pyrophosphatase MutT (NUDIX family)
VAWQHQRGPLVLLASFDMFTRHDIETAVSSRRAWLSTDDAPRASVASIFRQTNHGSTELLFIERSHRDGDPWSGHLAFPGGRVDAGDDHSEATAARETWEEIGLDLAASASAIGQLDDLEGPTPSRLVTVSLHAWWLDDPQPPLDLNYEVEDAFWVDLAVLLDPERHIQYDYPVRPGMKYPGIDLDGRVLWGLTLRLVDGLFERLGHSMPVRPV